MEKIQITSENSRPVSLKGKKRCFNGTETSLQKTYLYFPYLERVAKMTPKTAIQVTVLQTLKNVCSLICV